MNKNENAQLQLEPRLTRLVLRNVRCFEDVTLQLDPRVTVLIGENGAGKTTVAEAIASLCYGDDEGLSSFPLRHGSKDGLIALYEENREAPIGAWTAGPREERKRLPSERLLFAYGRYRRVEFPETLPQEGMPEFLGPEWEDARSARLEQDLSSVVLRRRTATLALPDSHLLSDLRRYLRDLFVLREADPQMALAWRALDASVQKLGFGLEGIGMIEQGGRNEPVVRRHGVLVPLRELSDGYQSMLVIVFDLIMRFVYLQPSFEPALSRPAVVVVDEVDLHLHPRWQRAVVPQLVSLFPGAQIILTTHSPAVVQGAIDEGYSVVTLSEHKGVVSAAALSEKKRKALVGANIGSLLVEDLLFDLPSRYSPKFEKLEKTVRRVRRKMEAGTATPEDKRALGRALGKLEELVAEEEARWVNGPILSELVKLQLAAFRDWVASDKEITRGSSGSL